MSRKKALSLIGGLCLLYSLLVLLWSLRLSPGDGLRASLPLSQTALLEPGARELPTGEGRSELLPGERLNLNTADEDQLRLLPGIGEALARAIVADREANGPYTRVEELTRVPGIGEKRLEALRELVYVDEVER